MESYPRDHLSHTNAHYLDKQNSRWLCDVDVVKERTRSRMDGSTVVVQPTIFHLARVSVLHGTSGPLDGVPFIDDYVASPEPIQDLLTRFSGINPGDLDPSVSTHFVTSLKNVYLKLRFLIDAGVCFVGHGLKKDFRIINIYVPPEQIIDTVDLFHLENKRKLKLSFLAEHVLNYRIQQDTHDSIEDARTALYLYREYLHLKESGQLPYVLEHLYEIGRASNWGRN